MVSAGCKSQVRTSLQWIGGQCKNQVGHHSGEVVPATVRKSAHDYVAHVCILHIPVCNFVYVLCVTL